jgi:hypothetical protein
MSQHSIKFVRGGATQFHHFNEVQEGIKENTRLFAYRMEIIFIVVVVVVSY